MPECISDEHFPLTNKSTFKHIEVEMKIFEGSMEICKKRMNF